MDSVSSDLADISYSDEAPVLIAGSSELALARARRGIEASGRRVGASTLMRTPRNGSSSRFRPRPSGSKSTRIWAVRWTICSAGSAATSRPGAIAAVVSTTVDLHRPGARADRRKRRRFTGRCRRCRARRGARARRRAPGGERSAVRCRVRQQQRPPPPAERRGQSDRRDAGAPVVDRAAGDRSHVRGSRHSGEVPAIAAETVRSVIRARRLRARFFDEELFADPAWDMLLDLLQAELVAPARAGIEPVHRRRGPGDDRAALAQDDGRPGAVRAPRRPARRAPGVRRAGTRDERCAAPLFRRGRAGRR